MTKYKQLSQEQRYVMGRLLKSDKSKKEIAMTIGVDRSTIYRELKPNTAKRGIGAKEYRPAKVRQKAELRHKTKPKFFSFTADIRRFFPKKTDFTKITVQQVNCVEKLINARLVRKFNYQTPNAVFLQKLKVALIT